MRTILPQEQFTPRAHIWLARAFIAEADWQAERDHVAIAYVLARRWRRAVARCPTLQFVDVVRNYCAGLGDWKRSLTPRQLWVRALSRGLEQPDHWPPKASWAAHVGYWRAALRRAERWQLGELADPCRGRALHWGGKMDDPRGRMKRVDCGDTANIFYALRSSQ
ncbi:MAG: hypothetical protein ACWGPR_11560 [Candidatus Deferrimicrobiaceae bacterium]